MTLRKRMHILVGVGWIVFFGLALLRSGAFEPDAGKGLADVASPRRAIELSAPAVPAELVAAMQEGRYEDARRGLAALSESAKAPDDRAYYAYLRGIAERLSGNREAARETLSKAMQAEPSTRWAAKIQFELAGIELASGNPAAAEPFARLEAERLLGGDRKDRLANIYRAFARQLLEPNDPMVRPDPAAAYDLLDQARGIAKSPTLRAEFLFAMGRTSLAANDVGRAIENLQAYLKEYPEGNDRFRVRLELGEAQRKANQLLPARLTWSDLARDIERIGPAPRIPDISAIRFQALSGIPSTYGIPNPPDDTSLNLGVATIRRFLTAAPRIRGPYAPPSRSLPPTRPAGRTHRPSMPSRASSRRKDGTLTAEAISSIARKDLSARVSVI